MHVPDHRSPVVSALLDEIGLVRPGERALVALDGVDGVDKTHLAHELAGLSEARHERPLVRVSIDGFHRPRAERRAAGLGAEGFYSGSYRYEAFRSAVVAPLRGATRGCRAPTTQTPRPRRTGGTSAVSACTSPRLTRTGEPPGSSTTPTWHART